MPGTSGVSPLKGCGSPPTRGICAYRTIFVRDQLSAGFLLQISQSAFVAFPASTVYAQEPLADFLYVGCRGRI